MSRQILHGQFQTAFRLRRGPRCSHQYQCDAAVSRSLFGHFPWRTRPKVDGISRRHRVRLLLVDCILAKAKSLMVNFELLPLYLCVIESTNAMLRLLAMVSLTTDSSLSGVDATEIWYDAGSGGRWECFLSYDPKYWTFGHLIFNDEPWAWFGEICSYTSLIYQVEINFIESRSSLTQQWKWEFGNNLTDFILVRLLHSQLELLYLLLEQIFVVRIRSVLQFRPDLFDQRIWHGDHRPNTGQRRRIATRKQDKCARGHEIDFDTQRGPVARCKVKADWWTRESFREGYSGLWPDMELLRRMHAIWKCEI